MHIAKLIAVSGYLRRPLADLFVTGTAISLDSVGERLSLLFMTRYESRAITEKQTCNPVQT